MQEKKGLLPSMQSPQILRTLLRHKSYLVSWLSYLNFQGNFHLLI